MYKYTVITLITNNYELVREIKYPQENVEYLLITDNKDLTSKTWKVIYEPEIDKPNLTPQEKIYYIKWNKLFDYCHSDYILRIDGAILLLYDITPIIDIFINNKYDIAVMCHPFTYLMLSEYDEWIKSRNLDPIYKEKFIKFCNKKNFDINYKGLIETTIMLYHKNKNTIKLLSNMYNSMKYNRSLKDKNDQCYFTYNLTKNKDKLNIWLLHEQAIFSKYMWWCYHNTNMPVDRIYDENKQYKYYIFNEIHKVNNLKSNISKMNNNLTIYVCTHKDFDESLIPNNTEYKVLKNSDLNNGDNLFALDKAYSEGSQMYYIYKNLELPDYVGICHYRRWWDIDELPNMNETFKEYDCITTVPYKWDGYNNIAQYNSVLNINDLKIIQYIISKLYPDYLDSFSDFFNSNEFHPFNMFIMKKEDFKAMCKFSFSILKNYDKIMGFKTTEDVLNYVKEHKENYLDNGKIRTEFESVARLEGHLLERLTNIFILHNFKNVKEIPVKLIDKYFD